MLSYEERRYRAEEYYRNMMYHRFTQEATLLSYAKEFLEMLGAAVVRQTSETAGISDLIICYQGRFIACELKRNDGQATEQQLAFIKKIQRAGGVGGVCRTLHDILNLVDCAVQDSEFLI